MRILLASMDQRQARDITVILSGQSFSVEHADDAEDALQLARHYHFDAILFSGGLNGQSGADFVRRLRATGSNLPALAVTRTLDGRARSRLLDTGADDVVEMPCDVMELCARLRAVVRRARGFTRSVLTVGPVELRMDSRSATVLGEELHLSPSEYKVLELLILRKGSAVSKTALMDLLYGEMDEPDVKSLNVLMHRLRKRLASAGIDEFVRTVWGTGYLVAEPTRADAGRAAPAAARPLAPFLASLDVREMAGAD